MLGWGGALSPGPMVSGVPWHLRSPWTVRVWNAGLAGLLTCARQTFASRHDKEMKRGTISKKIGRRYYLVAACAVLALVSLLSSWPTEDVRSRLSGTFAPPRAKTEAFKSYARQLQSGPAWPLAACRVGTLAHGEVPFEASRLAASLACLQLSAHKLASCMHCF
jgi:hypothetical protein